MTGISIHISFEMSDYRSHSWNPNAKMSDLDKEKRSLVPNCVSVETFNLGMHEVHLLVSGEARGMIPATSLRQYIYFVSRVLLGDRRSFRCEESLRRAPTSLRSVEFASIMSLRL